jgi:hypothetical protein
MSNLRWSTSSMWYSKVTTLVRICLAKAKGRHSCRHRSEMTLAVLDSYRESDEQASSGCADSSEAVARCDAIDASVGIHLPALCSQAWNCHCTRSGISHDLSGHIVIVKGCDGVDGGNPKRGSVYG